LPFGVTIVYNKRTRLSEEEEKTYQARFLLFDEFLEQVDIIILTCSLNDSTNNLINEQTISKMKNGVVIVNVARGNIIDETALLNALQSGKIFSVGLDVFNNEPKISSKLFESNKVMLLPHIGWASPQTFRVLEEGTLYNLESTKTKGNPVNPLNQIS